MKNAAYRQAEQMRCPKGITGRFAGRMMGKANSEAAIWTIGLLELRDNDHVLEIGFGIGLGIQEASLHVTHGRVEGIDLSIEMVRAATKLNEAGTRKGIVRIIQGSADKLPYERNAFDKVFAINVLYFWDNPKAVFTEIERVLKPGGRLALYTIEKNDLLKLKPSQTDVFHKYGNDLIDRLLREAGFAGIRTETKREKSRTGVCMIGSKPK